MAAAVLFAGGVGCCCCCDCCCKCHGTSKVRLVFLLVLVAAEGRCRVKRWWGWRWAEEGWRLSSSVDSLLPAATAARPPEVVVAPPFIIVLVLRVAAAPAPAPAPSVVAAPGTALTAPPSLSLLLASTEVFPQGDIFSSSHDMMMDWRGCLLTCLAVLSRWRLLSSSSWLLLLLGGVAVAL